MKRRTFLASAAMLPLLPSAAGATSATRIGTPIHVVNTPGGTFNGAHYHTIAAGKPCSFYVLDPMTGKPIQRFPIPEAEGGWGLAAAGRTVYFGTYFTGAVYRYRPGSAEIEELGKPVAGARFVWRLATDDRGRVYGGAEGHGFRWDTSGFRDYGVIVEGESYVRSVAYGHGKVYWGIGAHPHLIEMDAHTGSRREIAVPADLTQPPNSFVYDLTFAADLLFARFESSRTLLVIDPRTRAVIDRIDDTYGLDVSPARNGRVYFIRSGELTSYDVDTKTLTPTGFRPTATEKSHARGYGWIDRTLVSMTGAGQSWWYDSSTGRHVVNEPQLDAEAVVLRSIHTGPDGRIYLGGYFSGGLGIFDPITRELSEHPDVGQIESFTSYGGRLYLGIYPEAKLLSFDPSQPWSYGTNPVEHLQLHDQRQTRPLALTPVGDRIAIGTAPDYGQTAGALAIYDPATGSCDVHRAIAGEQSITALIARDGLIYAGTSPNATLLVVDPNGTTRWQGQPLAGDGHISALTFGPDGLLWGISTDGDVFAWDPASRQVQRQTRLFPDGSWDPAVDLLLRIGQFRYDEILVGSVFGKLFRLDPQSLTPELIHEPAYLLTRDAAGTAYFTSGTDLFAMPL